MAANVPVAIAEATAVELVKGVIDCYKELAINKELAATERYKVDKHVELYMAQIQSEEAKYRAELNTKHEERMQLITAVCGMMGRGNLTAVDLEICKYILGLLSGDGNGGFALPSSRGV